MNDSKINAPFLQTPAPWEANSTLFPRQQCLSCLIPNPALTSNLLPHCPADTEQHSSAQLPFRAVPGTRGCVCAACGTGTLPQPGVSSAGPRWAGLWASPMSPSQCKPFTDRTVRAPGFTATTRPQELCFPRVRRILLFQVPGALCSGAESR